LNPGQNTGWRERGHAASANPAHAARVFPTTQSPNLQKPRHEKVFETPGRPSRKRDGRACGTRRLHGVLLSGCPNASRPAGESGITMEEPARSFLKNAPPASYSFYEY